MRGGPERVVLKEGRGFHLICLPFAGGSARPFVRLARYTPPDWQVAAVQPPAGSAHGAVGLDGLASFYLGLPAADLRMPGLVLGHSLAISGWRLRRCWNANRPSSTTAAASTSGIVTGPTTVPQSYSSPSRRPKVSANRLAETSTTPARSSPVRCGFR